MSAPPEPPLHDLQHWYREAFEYAPIGMGLSGMDHRWHYVNRALCALTGYHADELLKMNVADLTHPDDRAETLEQIQSLIRNEVPFVEATKRYVRKDGTVIWARRTASLVRDDAGAPRFIIVQLQDITRKREIEQLLAESERRYRTLFETMENGVSFMDAEGRVTLANPAAARILGLSLPELLSEDVSADHWEFLRADGTPMPLDELPASIALRTGRAVRNAVVGMRDKRSGAVHWLLAHCIPQFQPGETAPSHVLNTFSDITALRDAEAALREREEELRRAQKAEAVGRLAGGIAHDFNNVLTAITGHAEFLAEMFPEGDAARADIDGIRIAAARAARLTAQLLAFSRAQLMHPTDLDLREVVLDMRVMLRRLIGDQIRLECLVADAPVMVHADRAQIEQVLINLVLNARDAMSAGGTLTVSVSVSDLADHAVPRDQQLSPGRYAVMTVTDTGQGIPEHISDKVFDPFFTTKQRGQGSGLGLSTAFGIVKQSDGAMYFETESGQGTRFHVLLPMQVQDARAARRRDTRSARAARERVTILVVEDEASVRNMAERVLRRQGYTVLTAANGAQALNVLASRVMPVDLVITDVVMPEMSGPALAATLAEKYPDTAIVFMSGYTDHEINEAGIKAASAAFLPKPFTPHGLAQLVRTVLGLD